MKFFLLAGFFLTIFQPILAQNNSTIKYFEGIVDYDIRSESYMQGVSDNEIRERIGSTLRLYFKDGNYMREYFDGAGYTLRKFFYLKDKNRIYDYNPMVSPDTLYYSDASDVVYEGFSIIPGQPAIVLDCECPAYEIKAKYVASFIPDTGNVTMTYYFCPALTVNPDWHKEMYIWKDVIKQGKSIAIKFIEDDPLFLKQTYTATKITWQPLPDAMFKIDPRLIQVQMQKQ